MKGDIRLSETGNPDKGRRAALLRLGLGALAVYTTPALTTLSRAQASTGSGGSGGGSGGGGGGGSGGGSGASGDSAGSAAGGSSASSASAAASAGASSASAPSEPSDGNPATISARDHRRAQKAVSEGRALPLIEVLKEVNSSLAGNLISVRYRETRNTNRYILKVLTNDGRLVEINVDARTAEIIGAGG